MAGANATRRRQFFSAHSKCCFCGGDEIATTEDHVPGRSLFLGRVWPTGYVFPACVKCNNSTSHDESLIVWLVRIRITEFSSDEEREFDRYTFEVSKRFPDIWNGLKFHSRVESRRFLKEMGVPSRLPGVDGVLHSMDFPDGVLDVAAGYGEKLGKSLHYLHTGRIVPVSGVVDAKVYTNAHAMGSEFPVQVFSLINGETDIRRAATSLKSQFNYRYAIAEAGEASAFVVSFGESFVLVISIFLDRDRHEKSQIARRLQEINAAN